MDADTSKRYSPTQVKRRILGSGHQWIDLETYTDATVRDQGSDGFLDAPTAMLRAYAPDVSFFGDPSEYMVVDEKLAQHYGDEMLGMVIDVDGDIALRRILGIVLSKHSFGHGNERWTVLVGRESDGEWNGWDGMRELRPEQWWVEIHDKKGEEDVQS